MNKIDVLLNSISHKHLCIELVQEAPPQDESGPFPSLSLHNIHMALLAAFKSGTSHAVGLTGNRPGVLIREVDIDLRW